MTRANKRKFHYVYRIDRFDGKFYIGLHSTDNMDDGYFGSGTRLSNSLRYHGKDKHSKTILEQFASREEAAAHEKFLITDEMRAGTMCLNLAPGGGGGFKDEAHFAKCSAAAVEATKRRHKERGQPQACIDALERGRKPISRENSCDWNGRNHKQETKAQMSVSHQGEKNSQFGTCWVTNGTPVKIKKDQLDEYLSKGYSRGRKSS